MVRGPISAISISRPKERIGDEQANLAAVESKTTRTEPYAGNCRNMTVIRRRRISSRNDRLPAETLGKNALHGVLCGDAANSLTGWEYRRLCPLMFRIPRIRLEFNCPRVSVRSNRLRAETDESHSNLPNREPKRPDLLRRKSIRKHVVLGMRDDCECVGDSFSEASRCTNH